VNSDFYKPYHPEYGQLLAEDDKTAAVYTSLDGRRWTAMAKQDLTARRVDIVIETTMRVRGHYPRRCRAVAHPRRSPGRTLPR
jgi:UDP-N-acetylglucosamine kinase